MSSFYWYISRSKIEALRHERGKSLTDWLEEFSLKLHIGSIGEANASIRLDRSLIQDAKRVEKDLLATNKIRPFTRIKPGSSAFFSFKGPANRWIAKGACWIAMESSRVALLMIGSEAYVTGAEEGKVLQSGSSLAPIQTMYEAFVDPSNANFIGRELGRVWGNYTHRQFGAKTELPHIEGLAIYAGTFPLGEGTVHEAWLRRLKALEGIRRVKEIVVGSPIFVRQA